MDLPRLDTNRNSQPDNSNLLLAETVDDPHGTNHVFLSQLQEARNQVLGIQAQNNFPIQGQVEAAPGSHCKFKCILRNSQITHVLACITPTWT